MPTRTAQIQEDTHFKIMRILQDNPDQTQRELDMQIVLNLDGSLHQLQMPTFRKNRHQ